MLDIVGETDMKKFIYCEEIHVVTHRVSTGNWEGAGKVALNGAIDGAVDGFMTGGIMAGGSQVTSAGFKVVAKAGAKTGVKGGIKLTKKTQGDGSLVRLKSANIGCK